VAGMIAGVRMAGAGFVAGADPGPEELDHRASRAPARRAHVQAT
jgi:hypothetical protein